MNLFGVDDEEYAAWKAEADRYELPVGDWALRVIRYMLETDSMRRPPSINGRRRPLASEAMDCLWCGQALPKPFTVRRRYCSDRCRVEAWRSNRAVPETDPPL
jgi:hypothetical protein